MGRLCCLFVMSRYLLNDSTLHLTQQACNNQLLQHALCFAYTSGFMKGLFPASLSRSLFMSFTEVSLEEEEGEVSLVFVLQEVGDGQDGIRVSIVACASSGDNAGNYSKAHTKRLRPLSEVRWECVPILTL
jgi:hypothetical protein